MQVKMIALSNILDNPKNIRTVKDGDDGVWDLASSIRSVGLLQPLTVMPGEGPDSWILISGHRRLHALRLLCGVDDRFAEAPCVVRPPLDGTEQILVMLVENAQRQDVDPVDKGQAYKVLADFGLSQEQIGHRVGVTQTVISEHLRIIQLPQEDQDAIREGKLSVKAGVRRHRQLFGQRPARGIPRDRAVPEPMEQCPTCKGKGLVPRSTDSSDIPEMLSV